MICGRCGHRTAENSAYCPHCRWTLYTETPEGLAHDASAVMKAPRGGAGMLARRKQESYRSKLEKTLRNLIDPRLERLEEELEDNAQNFESQRTLGVLSLLEGHFERAHAHLHRAYELNRGDYEAASNYGIVLAQRGQLQPALDVFQKARAQWPDNPQLLFNYSLVALQARRAELVLELVDALERLWYDNPAIADDYHDEAQTVRGLAMLLQNRPGEAKAALEAAASHTVTLQRAGPAATSSTPTASTLPASDGLPETPAADAASQNGASPEDDLDAIQYLPKTSEYNDDDEALEVSTLLEGKAANADLLNNLAMAEAALGQADAAVARLYAALRLDPGHTRVLNNLGVLAYEQGQLQTALQYLEIARQIEEELEEPEPTTMNHLGVVLSALGRLDEGMQRFQRAGSHERAEFEVFYNLGRAYIEHGHPESGVEYLRQAFQLNPHSADVHIVLGAAYLLRGKSELLPEAMKHLKRALQLNPKSRVAFADLTLALIDSNNKEGAVRVIQQALKTNPRSAEVLFLLALLIMERGDEQHWTQAVAQFGAALDERPDLVAALYDMALCQYLVGFRDSAAQQLQIVTDRDPSFAPAYFLIGIGHAVGKRYDEALTAWHNALKYEPNNPELHSNIGYVYYKKSDWQAAIKYFMTAHRLDPRDAGVLGALGLCFARANMMQQAITSFQQSLALNPRSPITHSNLGLAYYIHKHVEKAIEHWRIVSQLDSDYARRKEEEEQRSFDDSSVAMTPFNWRERTIRLAPTLPRPHTRLVPGFNARHFRPVISDPSLQQILELHQQLADATRYLAWMSAK
jgi:tetratricopeptide (TPR) repeat protein